MAKTLTSLVIVIATLASAVVGYSDNCSGSSSCQIATQQACYDSISGYDDSTNYKQYTSRTSGSCTAIYRCTGVYPNADGATLKTLFNSIYDLQGCKNCGSHAFDDGTCEVTLNYCAPDSCKNVG
ncbi:hypothetical protein BGZ99_010177 [Dissophora globulifera]|uniref:Uncharacterized protein n=1 Tax=Dissophora globulifera TaxID=979702 RepID=A0A9P6R2Y9_9FUNG|nr:hypothetical protein BGZ99_010177 [Dissophora globulifera]